MMIFSEDKHGNMIIKSWVSLHDVIRRMNSPSFQMVLLVATYGDTLRYHNLTNLPLDKRHASTINPTEMRSLLVAFRGIIVH